MSIHPSLRPVLLAPALLALAGTPALQAQRSASRPAAAPAPAATAIVVDPSLADIDSLLAATYPDSGPGAAVIVAREGQVLLRKAYGLANVELGVPATPEHVFRIGSMTKQFTAVAILLLAEEGRLSLDDDITRFFPDWPTHGRRITVEHLLTHTSGIRSYTSMPEFRQIIRRDHSLDELLAVFRDQPMDFAPGDDWRYNNSAYILLGAIVEKASGQGYAEFLRTRIFEPLGMTRTAFETHAEVIPGRAAGYEFSAQRTVRNADFLSMTLPHAAGSLVSTVDDLLRWQRAVAGRRLLREESWRRAFTPVRLNDGRSSGYGYGWFLGRAAGEPSVEHGGDINGFSSDGLWIPGAGVHVVVLSNVERNFANPATVSQRAAERILGRANAAPAVALSPEALDAYVGVYRTGDEPRVVTREGASLFSRRGAGEPQELRPLGGDEFAYASGTRATFVRGDDGRVVEMRLRPRLGPEQPPSRRTDERPEQVLAGMTRSVEVPAARLEAYVGEYELTPDFVLTVRREGEGLRVRATGQPELALTPRSETRFTTEGVEASIEFESDASGAVTGLVLVQGGRRMPAKKIR